MKIIKLPEDFVKRDHPLATSFKGSFQYAYPDFDKDKTKISIIGGNDVFYCDGSDDSFEMFDFRQSNPQGYLTKKQINKYLKNSPF